jgi:hypothetical protein
MDLSMIPDARIRFSKDTCEKIIAGLKEADCADMKEAGAILADLFPIFDVSTFFYTIHTWIGGQRLQEKDIQIFLGFATLDLRIKQLYDEWKKQYPPFADALGI